jgi:hypothetical protein
VGSRASLDGCRKSRFPPGFDYQTVHAVASYTDNSIMHLTVNLTKPNQINTNKLPLHLCLIMLGLFSMHSQLVTGDKLQNHLLATQSIVSL